LTEKDFISIDHPDDFEIVELRIHKKVLSSLGSAVTIKGIAGNLYGLQDAFLLKLIEEIRKGSKTIEFVKTEDKERYGQAKTKSGGG
jgi:hypothetical protein